MPNRTDRLLELMKRDGLQAAWIKRPENIRYLTGYTGEGSLLVLPGGGTILTDFRYTEQAGREAGDCTVLRTTHEAKEGDLIRDLLREHAVDSLAFEPDAVTVAEYEGIKWALCGIPLVPLHGLPEALRKVKDKEEIECVVRAAKIACQAFENMLSRIQPGMTERQIQQQLDYEMLTLGSEQVAFQTIACAGPNGSLPHATPGERPVQRGELLTMDFGAQVNGYKCDMTRTVAIGAIAKELKDIYSAVLEAQALAFARIRPGVCCKDVDAAARNFLDERYPGAFGHGLGHGVGLMIHESPNFNTRCEETLAHGHVMTVEPGIYIPGLGGCRIEDMAIITEDGFLNPITATKELIVL